MERLMDLEKVFCEFGAKMVNLNRLENFVSCVYGLTMRKDGTDKVLVREDAAIKVIGIETYEEWEKTYNELMELEKTYKTGVAKYEMENPGKRAVIIERYGMPTIWGVDEDML